MKLEQLIKKLGLPENPRKGKGDYYGYSEYWKFSDGSIVMEKDQLEHLMCQQEQENFWDEANRGSLEGWVVGQLDIGSSFKDEAYWVSEILVDYQNPEPLAGEYASVSEALSNGVYWNSDIEIESNLDGIENITIALGSYFDEYYSKTTGLFCWGDSSIEDSLLDYFESDSYTYELWLDLKTALQESFPKHAKKLIVLISNGEGFARQAFELIKTLDEDLELEEFYDDFSDEEFVAAPFKGFEKIAIALEEIAESPSDPYSDLFDWVVSEVSDHMDWSKPFSIYQAYTDQPEKYGKNTLHINEDRINWDLCRDLEGNLDAFEYISWIDNEKWKKIFQMGDWFIALA